MKCRFCKGPLMLLGQLGPMKHYRCRDCGAQFTKDAKKAAVDPEARRASLIDQLTGSRTANELVPGTLHEEGHKLRAQALELRATFERDPQFRQFRNQIHEATLLLEKAADLLQVDDPNLRMAPHHLHNQGQQ